MRIKQISVNGLFGIFDHVIPLNIHERITIIHGPNGFGKTAILRLLNGFFNTQYSELSKIPFDTFRIEFDDNSVVEIIKKLSQSQDLEEKPTTIITINFHQSNSQEPLSFFLNKPKKNESKIRGLNISSLDELDKLFLPLQEISGKRLGGHEKSSDDIIVLNTQNEPEWLRNIKDILNIYFIDSQRLLNFVDHKANEILLSKKRATVISTVSVYSEELAKLMQDKFKEYGAISQSLDRTFPIRVVKQQPSADISNEQLRQQLHELEVTRSRLIEVGLLDKQEVSEPQIQPKDIDESTKKALSVYVEDVEKKLNVFDKTARKIDLLRRIINSKFAYSYKEINFNKDKGFIFTSTNPHSHNSQELSPTELSSGEQHELVLLYELLFKVEPNSLVLIDEPELSLHVGWQTQFLKDLQDIIKLADLDVLMATHSPDIIQDRWDLTVELQGTKK
jgi:predicted ATP-binding protein involved in virulence